MQIPQRRGRVITGQQAGRPQLRWIAQPALDGIGLGRVPTHPTGADQQNVAGRDGGALELERAQQIFGRHGVGVVAAKRTARLLAEACDVRQHATADDAAAAPVVDAVCDVRQPAVPAMTSPLHMPEAVPLARHLGVDVVEDVVLEDLDATKAGDLRDAVSEALTLIQWRRRLLPRQVQRKGTASPDLSRSRAHAFRREQVERAEAVLPPPHAPGAAEPLTQLELVVGRECHAPPQPAGRS